MPGTTGVAPPTPSTVNDASFVLLFNGMPGPALLIDSQTQLIIDANPAFVQATQYERQQLLGQPAGDFPLWGHPRRWHAMMRSQARQGSLRDQPIELLRRDGGLLSYQVSIVKLNQQLLLCLQPRASSNASDQALKDSRSRLRMALEAGQMGIWDWQIATDALHCSARSAELHGFQAADWDGCASHFLQHVVAEDRQAIRRAFIAICRGREPRYRLTYRVVANKRQRWLQATATLHLNQQGQPARMIGTLVDITDQRRNQNALVESEAKFAILFQNAPDPYCLVQNQRVIEVNQSFARTFGYSAIDLIGRQPEEIGLWSSHSAHRSLQQAARGERELHGDLSDLITRKYEDGAVVFAGSDDTLDTVFKRMRGADVSQLPIFSEGRLVGIVDESDLVHTMNTDAITREERFRMPVSKVMTRELDTVQVNEPLEALVPLFDRDRVAIVLDGEKFVGLITRSDLINHLSLNR